MPLDKYDIIALLPVGLFIVFNLVIDSVPVRLPTLHKLITSADDYQLITNYFSSIIHQIFILVVLFPGGILRGSRRERLLSKFVENECEKIDRLMELYIRYWLISLVLFLLTSQSYRISLEVLLLLALICKANSCPCEGGGWGISSN